MNWRDSKYLRALVKGACLFVAACLLVGGVVMLIFYELESLEQALWLCVGMLTLGTATLVSFLISEVISSKRNKKIGG